MSLAGVRIGARVESIELLRFVLGHADQPHVAEVGGALLEAAGAVELPAADNGVEDAGQVAAEALVAADGHRPVPLRLDRVTDAGVGRTRRASEMEAQELRSFLERVLVTAVERQPMRQPPPQLDLHARDRC